MQQTRLIAFALTLISCSLVQAGYRATGPIEGSVCSGFVIESCKIKTVAAVEGSNGNLHEVTRYFKDVTEYKASNNRCFIRLKSKGLSVIGAAIDKVQLPTFYERVGTVYKKIDVEYLTFNCRPE